MTRVIPMLCVAVLASFAAPARSAPIYDASATRGQSGSTSAAGTKAPKTDLVEFEMMTWPEVKRAIHEQGKTVALVYNGGTEQRGPQNVNGGHTLMSREVVKAIALRLGNAVAAPVMPFAVDEAIPELPGSIGLSAHTFALVNQEVAEQLIKNGFKTVILMGDHAGGQEELRDVATTLDRTYAPQGVHVYHCDEVYGKANGDFDKWLAAQGYPASLHAGIPDTSEMLYLGGTKGWVRQDLIAAAVGDPVPAPGQEAAQTMNNGIIGDARRSSATLGKRLFDMKVEYAVAQITRLLEKSKTARP